MKNLNFVLKLSYMGVKSMRIFKYKRAALSNLSKPLLCAIVNVTPDSFSDGGKWLDPGRAIEHALEMIEEGAGMIDIGGESTRPGSEPVSAEEEMARVIPVIRALRAVSDVPISIDTWKSEVARAAIEAGADIVNDITGLLGDEAMAGTVARSGAGLIAMFNPVMARPSHEGSKVFPKFGGGEVFSKSDYDYMEGAPIVECMDFFFDKTLERAKCAGLDYERIMLDPGIGFGLTKRENLELIKSFNRLHERGFMAFLGLSRKRFIANIIEEEGFCISSSEEGTRNKDMASSYLSCLVAMKGVEVLRVHTVKEHRMALALAEALHNTETVADRNFAAYQNSMLKND